MPKITITIPREPSAPTKFETEGFVGGACKAVTEGMKKALGGSVSETETAEFYQEVTGEQTQQIMG